jgi:hypothetical protein
MSTNLKHLCQLYHTVGEPTSEYPLAMFVILLFIIYPVAYSHLASI